MIATFRQARWKVVTPDAGATNIEQELGTPSSLAAPGLARATYLVPVSVEVHGTT